MCQTILRWVPEDSVKLPKATQPSEPREQQKLTNREKRSCNMQH